MDKFDAVFLPGEIGWKMRFQSSFLKWRETYKSSDTPPLQNRSSPQSTPPQIVRLSVSSPGSASGSNVMANPTERANIGSGFGVYDNNGIKVQLHHEIFIFRSSENGWCLKIMGGQNGGKLFRKNKGAEDVHPNSTGYFKWVWEDSLSIVSWKKTCLLIFSQLIHVNRPLTIYITMDVPLLIWGRPQTFLIYLIFLNLNDSEIIFVHVTEYQPTDFALLRKNWRNFLKIQTITSKLKTSTGHLQTANRRVGRSMGDIPNSGANWLNKK